MKDMWYVIQVAEGTEENIIPKIGRALENVPDCNFIVPKYISNRRYQGMWHEEIKVLFPGYMFVDTVHSEEVLEGLKIFSANVKPVCIGGGFYPIRKEEQEFLLSMMNNRYEIELSVGNIVDGRLIVDAGPLKNRSSSVCRIDRHKRTAELVLTLWGEKRRVKVGLQVKERLTGDEYRRRAVS
jgi:putative transcription antiterminator